MIFFRYQFAQSGKSIFEMLHIRRIKRKAYFLILPAGLQLVKDFRRAQFSVNKIVCSSPAT